MKDAGSLDEVIKAAYPKILYHLHKGTVTVRDKEEEAVHTEKHGYTTRYQHQDWPRLVYKPGEKPREVANEDEEKALGKGWQRQPLGSEPIIEGLESQVTDKHLHYLQSKGFRINDLEDARIYVRQQPEDMQQQFLDDVEVWEEATPFDPGQSEDSGAEDQAAKRKIAEEKKAADKEAKKQAAAERIAARKAKTEKAEKGKE